MTTMGQVSVGQSLAIFAVLCAVVPVVAITARACLSPLLKVVVVIGFFLLLPVIVPLLACLPDRVSTSQRWGIPRKIQAVGFYALSIVVVWLAARLVLHEKPAAFMLMLPFAHLPALCYWYRDRTTMTDRFRVFVPRYNIWAADGKSHELYELRFPWLRLWAQLGCHAIIATALIVDVGPARLLAVKVSALPTHDLSGPIAMLHRVWSACWSTIDRVLTNPPLPKLPSLLDKPILTDQSLMGGLVAVLALVLGISLVRFAGFMIFMSVVRARGDYSRVEASATPKYIIPSATTWLLVFAASGVFLDHIHADRHFDAIVLSIMVVWLYVLMDCGFWLHKKSVTGNDDASVMRHTAIVSGTAMPALVLCWTGAIAAVLGLFVTPPSPSPDSIPNNAAPGMADAASVARKLPSKDAVLSPNEKEQYQKILRELPSVVKRLERRLAVCSGRYSNIDALRDVLIPVGFAKRNDAAADAIKAVLLTVTSRKPEPPYFDASHSSELEYRILTDTTSNKELLHVIAVIEEIDKCNAWIEARHKAMDDMLTLHRELLAQVVHDDDAKKVFTWRVPLMDRTEYAGTEGNIQYFWGNHDPGPASLSPESLRFLGDQKILLTGH